MTGTLVGCLGDVPDGEGREFVFGESESPLRIVVVRRGDAVFGYVNCCPHHSVPLNDQPDRFVTFDHEWIICSVHGAVFRYEDGYCEDGPCRGRSLESVALAQRDGRILIA